MEAGGIYEMKGKIDECLRSTRVAWLVGGKQVEGWR